MTDYSKVKVGDKVWYSDVNRKLLQHTFVTKVGTKLITVGDRGKVFRKDNGRTNDKFQHQTLILDFYAYYERKAVVSLLQKLRVSIPNSPHGDVTSDDVKTAARLLKVEL
jgi:hypothetical protein